MRIQVSADRCILYQNVAQDAVTAALYRRLAVRYRSVRGVEAG